LKNPNTNFDTDLVENGNQVDNGNDSQIGLAVTSDENFVFPEQLSDLLKNIVHRFESLNSELAE